MLWTSRVEAGEVASVPASTRSATRPAKAVPGQRRDGRLLPWLVLGGAGLALAVAVVAPMATIVLGLVFFGVLAAVLSSRYLLGRFAGLLEPTFARVLVALATAVAASGLLVGVAGRPAELARISLGYAVLAVAVHQWRGTTRRVVAWAVLGGALAASLAFPAYHVVVLGHLLALAPLGFLWEWASELPQRKTRRGFRAAVVLAYAGMPVALLAGALDPWLTTQPGRVRSVVGDGGMILSAAALPGTEGTPLAARLLAVSAFLGTLGYAVWIVFFPRAAPEATEAVERRLPWATAPRVWAGAFTAAAGLAVAFSLDFGRARAVLDAVTAYPTLLGVAVLVVLAGSGRPEKVLPEPSGPSYGRRTEPEGRWSEK